MSHDSGLHDRSLRPHSMPTRTPVEVEARIVTARVEHRRGQDWLSPELGIPARTVSGCRVVMTHRGRARSTVSPESSSGRQDDRSALRASASRRACAHRREETRPDSRWWCWRAHGRTLGQHAAARSASTSCTPPLTTSAASPTARSWPTNAPTRPPGSSSGPRVLHPPPA